MALPFLTQRQTDVFNIAVMVFGGVVLLLIFVAIAVVGHMHDATAPERREAAIERCIAATGFTRDRCIWELDR